MTTSADIRALIDEALTEFDQPGMSVAANVRRAHRIASLRHDLINLFWLQLELSDVTVGREGARVQDPSTKRVRDQLDALLGAEDAQGAAERGYLQWERNRTAQIDGDGMLHGTSIGQIEVGLRQLHAIYDEKVPTNLAPGDAYQALQARDSGKATILPHILRDESIVERVRSAVYTFLVNTENELDAGQQSASVFTRAQEYVNATLQTVAPDALQKFVSAQDQLYSDDPEGPSYALTACRRMIKALADALYPATDATVSGEDGVDRVMSNDRYRNRLLQWVRDKVGAHAQTTVVKEAINSLDSRLKALDSLASKGVHDEVTVAEAETCVAQTYLLAADFLRLADGTSALLSIDQTTGTQQVN